jgi:hypothetical protein
VKTPRERIADLVTKLRTDAERDRELGGLLLEKAEESDFLAGELMRVLPELSDEMCADIVAAWKKEDAENHLN